MPIFLPEDRGIPAPAVPAPTSFNREFVSDKEVLQREAKTTSGALSPLAYGAVLAIALGLFALLGWGLDRVASGGSGPTRGTRVETGPKAATTIGPAAPAGR
jgi:hypothetical protein